MVKIDRTKKILALFEELKLEILNAINEKKDIKGQAKETNQVVQHRNLIPLHKWPQYHPYPTVGQLRWYFYKNQNNFRDECTQKLGRRVLIDEGKYFEWVEKVRLLNKD